VASGETPAQEQIRPLSADRDQTRKRKNQRGKKPAGCIEERKGKDGGKRGRRPLPGESSSVCIKNKVIIETKRGREENQRTHQLNEDREKKVDQKVQRG